MCCHGVSGPQKPAKNTLCKKDEEVIKHLSSSLVPYSSISAVYSTTPCVIGPIFLLKHTNNLE